MMKKNKEKQARDSCSFKPKILPYKRPEVSRQEPPADNNTKLQGEAPISEKAKKKHTKVSTMESTTDRCKLLYELSKKIAKKDDKSTDLYKFEKDPKEYTFNPNLSKDGVNDKKPTGSIETMDKAVERMKKAREEKDRVKRALGRGSDDPGMRFNLQKDRFVGSFQQFTNGKEQSMKQSSSRSKVIAPEAIDRPVRSTNTPFSTEISPQPNRVPEEDVSQRASAAAPPANAAPVDNKPVEVPAEQPQPQNELIGSIQALSDAQSVDQSQHNSNPPTSHPETKEALLFIDVNLGNKQKRIVVYKGDTATELAEAFAKENGIIHVIPILFNINRIGRDR